MENFPRCRALCSEIATPDKPPKVDVYEITNDFAFHHGGMSRNRADLRTTCPVPF